MSDLSCLDIIGEKVIDDYFTPNVKSEIIFDMLFTPVIAEIVEAMTQERIQARVIAKEFPLLNRNFRETDDMTNCDVDYLMQGADDTWYLIELKTTSSSIDAEQLRKYREIVSSCPDIFAQFVELLSDIFNLKNKTADSLKDIFAGIAGDGDNYRELAQRYLVNNRGSKKYLYTAATLLENGIGLEAGRTEFRKLRLIYITPKKRGKTEDAEYLSIQEMLDRQSEIEALFKTDSMHRYWRWLVDILEKCYQEV